MITKSAFAARGLACCLFIVLLGAAGAPPDPTWPQWGQNAQHTGAVAAAGQPAQRLLADIVFDPFAAKEQADPLVAPDLTVHYQAPLIDGDDVFMELKTGTYKSVLTWQTQIWNEQRLHWNNGTLEKVWAFESDWKPVPHGGGAFGPRWEPVFHPALAGAFIYVPGFGGSVYKLDKSDGSVAAHIEPFGPAVDPDTFVAGPLTADPAGNVYYSAIKLNHGHPWEINVLNSWLVKIGADDAAKTATYHSLTPGAPRTNDPCLGTFRVADLPWPPSPDAVPPMLKCGAQRAAINSAPAVAPDGTIYIASVAHLTTRYGYLLAVNPDLTPRWQASLRDRFHDGCDVLIPPSGTPGGCRAGAHAGVDPAQNTPGGGRIREDSTASPVVAPDGSILYGVYARYNYSQGELMKFSPRGRFLGAYPFGWDDTPAIYVHDGTWSILTKENHYGQGSYCDVEAVCPSDRSASNPRYPQAFYMTQLSRNLVPEWRYRSRNIQSCSRDAAGNVRCVPDHRFGFEWCINAPAVDSAGVVYANSEDGGLYAIGQGGTLRSHLFLKLALGASYTPLTLDGSGRIYTENDGHLFVVGR